ncbi:MAG: VWA domain-containing protein [Acidobacteria bacterium]|nr:VWA domain-containing protein [Acidobacteriota bacterium]
MFSLGIAIATLPSTGRAQELQTVVRAEVNLVSVLFTAFDTKGRHIAGLTTSDLDIYEDGMKQDIEFLRSQGDLDSEAEPLTIVLLMDTSGSVKEKLGVERAIARDFFKRVLRRAKDLAAIVQFNTRVAPVQEFTDNVEKLEEALQSLTATGSTALYDAICLAAVEKLASAAGRRVIVIVSDGEDTSSRSTLREAIGAAQKNNAVIFAVGVNAAGSKSEFVPLRELAKETGGRFFNPGPKMREMAKVFREMIETLKRQYHIFYYSKNQRKDGAFRAIQIRIKRKHVHVLHRIGYYASGEQARAQGRGEVR